MMKNNIIGHIAGLSLFQRDSLNNLFKQSSTLKNITIIDVELINKKIINDNNMMSLLTKIDELTIKSKNKLLSVIEVKNAITEMKDIEKKMTRYWKAKLEYYLNDIISKHTNVLLIGYIHYIKNHKIYLNLNFINKFFVDIDLEQHAKSIIKYNLDNYYDDIINGDFDINYLDKNFLINKRSQFQTIYNKIGYFNMSLQSIINVLDISQQTSVPDVLYYASTTKYNKKIPIISNPLIAYNMDWIALVSIFDIHIKKGMKQNNSYITLDKEQYNKLNQECYLYEITNTSSFIPCLYGNILYKYKTLQPIKINRVVKIDNIIIQLKNLNIDIKKNV